MILLSAPRAQAVAALLILPPGAAIRGHFVDDGTDRDLTSYAATLLLEFLLRGDAAQPAGDADLVQIAHVSIEGGEWFDCRLALVDTDNHLVSEIPSEQLPALLAGALGMAVAEAVRAADEAELDPADAEGPADPDATQS